MKKVTVGFLALALGLLVSGIVVAASVPADKDVIKIDLIPGKQGAVELPHKKHVAEFKKKGGAAIVCKDCHHTLKTDEPAAGEKMKSCPDCHVKVGEAEKTEGGKAIPALAKEKTPGAVDQKTVIFHKTCMEGCHKEMKAEGKNISGCKTCHKK